MLRRFRGSVLLGRVRLANAVALILGAVVSVGLPTESRASVNTVQFSTSPVLYPAFDPAVRDYVVRLTSGTTVQVTVTNTDPSDTTTTVSADGQAAQTGAFATQVNVEFGQAFKITATQGVTSKDYYVRRLPSGFPTWTSQRPGSPQAEYYVVVPVPSNGVGIENRYITIYDKNGVLNWWSRSFSQTETYSERSAINRRYHTQ